MKRSLFIDSILLYLGDIDSNDTDVVCSARHMDVSVVRNGGVPGIFRSAFLMKKIECYIRQEDAQTLVEALAKTGVSGVTLYPVQGFGKQRVKGTGSLLSR